MDLLLNLGQLHQSLQSYTHFLNVQHKLCVADELQHPGSQGDPKPRGLPSGKRESDMTQGQPQSRSYIILLE
jgi:hypothetical protein